MVAAAWALGTSAIIAFCVGFFGCLCGSKLALALLAGRYRAHLTGPPYRWIMRGLAIAMAVFAIQFGHGGLERLGLL